MKSRNWLDLSRKLVDQYDMRYTSDAYQEILGEYAHGFWGTGVLPTTFYPTPFPLTLSNSVLQGTSGNGVAFDDDGVLIRIDSASPTSKTFTIPAADPTFSRKDLICIRWKDTGDTLVPKPSDPITSVYLNLHDDFQLVVRQGVASASPAYPAKQSGDVILAGLLVPPTVLVGTACTLDLSIRELCRINFAQNAIFQQETPTGLVNGINQDFVLSETPLNDLSLIIFIDGLPLEKTQYSRIGTSVTLTVAPAPGQSVVAFYTVDSPTSINPLSGNQETPTGAINGVNDTFTLSGAPADQYSTLVFIDGFLEPRTNWNLIQGLPNSKIKFNPGAIPAFGQSVYVFYFVNPQTVGVGGGGGGGGGGAGYTPYGTIGAPLVIDPAVGIPIANVRRQMLLLKGQTAGGEQVITANPQIAAGYTIGDELLLIGQNDIDYPQVNDGNGVSANGALNLKNKFVGHFVWDGADWNETSRR